MRSVSYTYTPFNKISHITEPANTKHMFFNYGPDNSRKKVEYEKDGTEQYTRYYSGSCEKTEYADGSEQTVYYIGGSNGAAAAYVKDDGISQLYYLHTDHLGSITTITNSTGGIVAEYSFDVWGNRRNPGNWNLTNNPAQSFTNRGFTGHVSEANILPGEAAAEYPAELIPIVKRIGEHIDEFKLIHTFLKQYR